MYIKTSILKICLYLLLVNTLILLTKCSLRILPLNDVIDGIIIHLNYKFIKYKVYAKGIHLNVNFENLGSVRHIIESYKDLNTLYCNLNKRKEEESIDKNTLRTNNCVIFVNIKYKENLKHIYDFMEYLYINTSAVALIFISDNFLYENEIYNPHEDLNITIIHPSILTYFISYDRLSEYDTNNYDKYIFELYWGVNHKTDIVHINYHLDYGKYFNYTFFIYMKNFLLDLKNHITYEIQFSIHKNFTIEPRFCFIRDSSYCISKPDYMNSNVVREVVEQQVRSLCIYELTLIDDIKSDIVQTDPSDVLQSDPQGKKKLFSEKYIYYINALFNFGFERKYCSSDFNDLTKKCSDKILNILNVSVKDVDHCFLNNFHTYMKNMIKSKFYVYSITINDKTYKIKLNKDISIKLICSAFKNMPKRCKDYLFNELIDADYVRENTYEELICFYFLIILLLVHIIGTFLNYLVPYYINLYEKKKNKERLL
ncbi:hypothetical protein PFBG_04192 [Plasmodium falciparum 7G8]|uniref:Uncharacterized protein n=1 Tax=Plasmodium falciparum (isolate 7G8) TaxID=57266 RepID=W7FB38_PLAF8|nr:hypothetical protein PFBG_04192 [Plasmodium falciparum 7G8]SOS80003.1 conserved Plasmodium protein, unknown function [Plasmodium sp. gorilla clade G1]